MLNCYQVYHQKNLKLFDLICLRYSGGWFSMKMPSYQCRKSHYGDKTILRPWISYTVKMISLDWIRALGSTWDRWKANGTFVLTSRKFCLDFPQLGSHYLVHLRNLWYMVWTDIFPCHVPGYLSHDDVIKWKYFPRYWPFVRGIHRSPVNSPHKGQWRGALMISLICARINGWVSNREAGDLRCYHAHYDVTVMWSNAILASEIQM